MTNLTLTRADNALCWHHVQSQQDTYRHSGWSRGQFLTDILRQRDNQHQDNLPLMNVPWFRLAHQSDHLKR